MIKREAITSLEAMENHFAQPKLGWDARIIRWAKIRLIMNIRTVPRAMKIWAAIATETLCGCVDHPSLTERAAVRAMQNYGHKRVSSSFATVLHALSPESGFLKT